MRLTLLAAVLTAWTMTACGKPNQALPEQEKNNYSKITSQPAAPAADDSDDASTSPTGNAAKDK